MDKKQLIILIFLTLFFACLILFHNKKPYIKEKIEVKPSQEESASQQQLEYAYFCGQRDAINNNITIKRISDTTWIWLESPWTDEMEVINDTIYN